jgi:pyruvate formate lyase activating enzyme
MNGRLHSIETMGLVDGPGIRTIIFLQGCPLRCAYCHNPDSQNMFSNKEITPEEVLNIAKKYKNYYKRSGGGITFSGGEPLLQGEFLLETLKLLKKEGFNTALDTSGYGNEKYYREILKYVDTVLLDIKHFDNRGYKELTGASMNGFYKFLSYLNDYEGKIWIRHVMVPGITDNKDSVYRLFANIAHLADKIERIEILPFHKMALDKYEALGREYKLKSTSEMNADKAKEYQDILNDLLNKEKLRVNNDLKII